MRSSHHADPDQGLFETLLVLGGRAVEVDAHVDRLTRSLAKLFDAELPDGAREAIAEGAHGLQRGRLRLTAVPTLVGPAKIAVDTAPLEEAEMFPPARQGIALRSFVVEGGLGAHKWVDRSLVDRFAASLPAAELPLLLDAGGEVLEAARANVFAIRDEILFTPPADGRIVPGIARARTLELARAAGREVREARLLLDDLLAAEEVFLTNSVRGVEPVRAIDGREVPHPGGRDGHSRRGTPAAGAGAEIATELRRRWLQVPSAESAAAVAIGRRAGRRAR